MRAYEYRCIYCGAGRVLFVRAGASRPPVRTACDNERCAHAGERTCARRLTAPPVRVLVADGRID